MALKALHSAIVLVLIIFIKFNGSLSQYPLSSADMQALTAIERFLLRRHALNQLFQVDGRILLFFSLIRLTLGVDFYFQFTGVKTHTMATITQLTTDEGACLFSY